MQAVNRMVQGLNAIIVTVREAADIVSVGSQGMSSLGNEKAKELYESGAIGQLIYAEGFWARNSPVGAWQYAIPEDVQVIGFDNIELSGVLIPKLTTIAQPIDDFGQVAMSILQEQMKQKPSMELHRKLPVQMIERETTKKA